MKKEKIEESFLLGFYFFYASGYPLAMLAREKTLGTHF